MANIPNIRFKGFTGDWEQRKLETISDVRDGTHDSPTYQNEGHPFVTSKNVKNGFINYDDVQYISDEDFEEINKRSKVDTNDILMGMIGTIGNLALIRTEPDFAIKNVALIKDTKQVSYLYLYHYLQSKNVEKQLFSGMDGGTQKFFALKKIRELKILIPSKDEQLQIGGFLENLDNLITFHQRKCDEVKQLKKFMLQKMFPKSDELIPAIRFVGFNGDWEQRKLKNEFSNFIVPIRDKPKEFGGIIPWTRIEDIEGKYLNGSLSGQYVTKDTVNKMNLKIIPKDSLIVSSSATFGVVAVVTQDVVTNQTFIGLVPNEKDTLDYWYAFFHSDEARKYMKLESAGSTIFYIARESFENMPIKVPKKEEKLKIGLYFDQLDFLITLYQRKCDDLKEVKRFMLQNMFPQKG